MALWPFSKKDKQTDSEQPAAQQVEPGGAEHGDAALDDAPKNTAASSANSADSANAAESGEFQVVEHDAINGDMGPFDGDSVDIEQFNFSDFASGVLDLGSLRIALPKGSQVQVEMGQAGPRMLHILTEHGRMTPVAFAAPRTPGQWADSARDIIEGLRRDGFEARTEQGPWGTEIVGGNGDGEIRMIGVDGPRWMYRLTLAAPLASAEQLAEVGREVVARTFVYRGSDPILAGSPLPVTLPGVLAQQVQEAMEKRQQQAQAAAAKSPEAAPAADTPEGQAAQQLRDIESEK
ncbi:DUF3710 domain-containing protein [Corynebacterium sp.]|uniref:DUF3710 domain-containing protein n=1 Tax=Corynebacterium sp. TaxID=1720 RepID=UPI0026DA6F0A|nr:DUF3710 domain-containing protein [Corynebacterium sp.]MDO5031720.1 DUF3710 domain-containing protein [Corynebacterium sp.]